MITPFYKSPDRKFTLLKGDCIELLNSFEFKFDMIFADPPYHLSNDGISVQSGRMVSVNKGCWDKSHGIDADYNFDKEWLSACRNKLKDNGTIWVSGTYHNICLAALNKGCGGGVDGMGAATGGLNAFGEKSDYLIIIENFYCAVKSRFILSFSVNGYNTERNKKSS